MIRCSDILLLIPMLSNSHPGPTDSRGGQWDNSTEVTIIIIKLPIFLLN